jgi:hypothetical protein
MKLEAQARSPRFSGFRLDELEGKVNYFIGNDPEKWHTDIPTFGRVHYASVYAPIWPPAPRVSNLPPILSSNGLVVNRGFVTATERPALLAYLRKL